jgi:hypothetical protein
MFLAPTAARVYADPVNPRQVMTLHLDRWTAQTLRDALASFVESGACAGSMLEIFEEWLPFEGGLIPPRRAPHVHQGAENRGPSGFVTPRSHGRHTTEITRQKAWSKL